MSWCKASGPSLFAPRSGPGSVVVAVSVAGTSSRWKPRLMGEQAAVAEQNERWLAEATLEELVRAIQTLVEELDASIDSVCFPGERHVPKALMLASFALFGATVAMTSSQHGFNVLTAAVSGFLLFGAVATFRCCPDQRTRRARRLAKLAAFAQRWSVEHELALTFLKGRDGVGIFELSGPQSV